MIDLTAIIEQAKKHKEFFLVKKAHMPPLVLVYRANVPLAVIQAPQVNKFQGLKAAHIARVGLAADCIVLLNDIYSYRATGRASYEEAKKRWPDGLMQNAVEQGLNTEGIHEALHLALVDEKLNKHTITVHYEINDGKIKWLDTPQEAIEDGRKMKISGGLIFESLEKIMKISTEILPELAYAMNLTDPNEIRIRTDRATVTAFQSMGYAIHYTGDLNAEF